MSMNILKFKLKFLRSLSTHEKCSNKKKSLLTYGQLLHNSNKHEKTFCILII